MLKFFKLSNGFDSSKYNIDEISKWSEMVMWLKAEYAKSYWCVLHEKYHEGVRIPDENEDSLNFATHPDGGKLIGNQWLLIHKKAEERGELFEAISDSYWGDEVIILSSNENETFITGDTDIPSSELIDVTDEYIKQLEGEVNPTEIREFVETHNADEVEDKYCIEEYREEFWLI